MALTKQQARDILSAAIGSTVDGMTVTYDLQVEANRATYGPGGYYNQATAAQVALLPPVNSPYAPPPNFAVNVPGTTDPGMFTQDAWLVQLNYSTYVQQCNNFNKTAHDSLESAWNEWRVQWVTGDLKAPPPAPSYEVPLPFNAFQAAWSSAGSNNTYPPPAFIFSAYPLPGVAWDYQSALVEKQKELTQSQPALASLFKDAQP